MRALTVGLLLCSCTVPAPELDCAACSDAHPCVAGQTCTLGRCSTAEAPACLGGALWKQSDGVTAIETTNGGSLSADGGVLFTTGAASAAVPSAVLPQRDLWMTFTLRRSDEYTVTFFRAQLTTGGSVRCSATSTASCDADGETLQPDPAMLIAGDLTAGAEHALAVGWRTGGSFTLSIDGKATSLALAGVPMSGSLTELRLGAMEARAGSQLEVRDAVLYGAPR